MPVRHLVLAAALLAAAAPARAADPPRSLSDVVLLLDVSGSMIDNRAFDRAKRLLIDVLDRVVHPGAQVAIVPFGDGVKGVTRFEMPVNPREAGLARARVRAAIEELRARDSFTYLYRAIESGLETLCEFKERAPDHARHVILISDGKDLTRDGVKSRTLDQIIETLEAKGFNRGDDWFIWYAHFGEADDRLREALERTGAGSTIRLDELPSLSWSFSRLEPGAVDLGRVRPGDWSRTIRLALRSDAVGQRLLLTLLPGDLPQGMQLSLAPVVVEIAGAETVVEAQLSCRDGMAGDFDQAQILVEAEKGSLHWVETPRIGVAFRVAQPRVALGEEVLALGPIAPGATETHSLALVPNADAADSGARIEARVEDPEGVTIRVEPRSIEMFGPTQIEILVEVARDAVPGARTGKLRFWGSDVAIEPAEVEIRFEVPQPAPVDLPALVDLGEVFASRAGLIPVRLELAARRDATLEFTASDAAFALEPRVAALRSGPNALSFRLRAGDASLGEHAARFSAALADGGAAGTVEFRWRVRPSHLRVQDWRPALGWDGAQATASLLLDASPDLKGRKLRLAVAMDRLALLLAPAEITLEGGLQSVPLSMVVRGAGAGGYEGSLRLALVEAVEGVAPLEPLPLRLEIATAVTTVVPATPVTAPPAPARATGLPLWAWLGLAAALAAVVALLWRLRSAAQPEVVRISVPPPAEAEKTEPAPTDDDLIILE
ncbi:MAG: vWA domain-containing protein [Planctomycetaceae bacterium]